MELIIGILLLNKAEFLLVLTFSCDAEATSGNVEGGNNERNIWNGNSTFPKPVKTPLQIHTFLFSPADFEAKICWWEKYFLGGICFQVSWPKNDSTSRSLNFLSLLKILEFPFWEFCMEWTCGNGPAELSVFPWWSSPSEYYPCLILFSFWAQMRLARY